MGLRGGTWGKRGPLIWMNSLSIVHVNKEMGEKGLKMGNRKKLNAEQHCK